MEVIKEFTIVDAVGKTGYVCYGLCDKRETMWITTSKWDKVIGINRDTNGTYYTDSKGEYMLVLEKDDPRDRSQWDNIMEVY